MQHPVVITEMQTRKGAIEIIVDSTYCNDHKPYLEPIK